MNEERPRKKPIGFTELKQWLRHRHPMVLLDRILDHEPGEFLTAMLVVSGGLDCVSGHFPERAVFPGSHLIQAFAQAGIILFQISTRKLSEDELTVISSVQARFFKIIVPGDRVEIQTRVGRLSSTNLCFSGSAFVDSRRVAGFRAALVRTPIASLGNQLW